MGNSAWCKKDPGSSYSSSLFFKTLPFQIPLYSSGWAVNWLVDVAINFASLKPSIKVKAVLTFPYFEATPMMGVPSRHCTLDASVRSGVHSGVYSGVRSGVHSGVHSGARMIHYQRGCIVTRWGELHYRGWCSIAL